MTSALKGEHGIMLKMVKDSFNTIYLEKNIDFRNYQFCPYHTEIYASS